MNLNIINNKKIDPTYIFTIKLKYVLSFIFRKFWVDMLPYKVKGDEYLISLRIFTRFYI